MSRAQALRIMVTLEKYIEAPCRILSIPYWKWKSMHIPENIKIIHDSVFSLNYLNDYDEEKYFRLFHNLKDIHRIKLEDYEVRTITKDELCHIISIINEAYADIQVNTKQMKDLTSTSVYHSDLWILVEERSTGKYVASGIADVDREAKELILEQIQVLPAYHGKKLGQLVVSELLYRGKDIANFATVSGNVTNPEALYRKCGFAGHDVWHILRRKGQLNVLSEILAV